MYIVPYHIVFVGIDEKTEKKIADINAIIVAQSF